METLIKLTNPQFQIEFAGKNYTIRKASIEQVVRFMKKVDEMKGKTTGTPVENGIEMLVYCLWIILSGIDPEITEKEIYENLPGDTDANELMIQLGFLNPKRALVETPAEVKPTSDSSSPSSPTGPAGDQASSENSQ